MLVDMMHVDSVVKSYGLRMILSDVFLTCEKGEIIGLFGRNGSGKSTLLKIIFGAIPADSKFIKVGDKIIREISDSYKIIKYLPQNSFLPYQIKVGTAIDFYCGQNAEIVKRLHLIKPFLSRRIKELSFGEIRLTEIFMLVFSEAEFVLLDEPFSKLSPVVKEEIVEIIKDQSSHKGFVITDHDYENILSVSTRIGIIQDGGTYAIKNVSDFQLYEYFSRSILETLRKNKSDH